MRDTIRYPSVFVPLGAAMITSYVCTKLCNLVGARLAKKQRDVTTLQQNIAKMEDTDRSVADAMQTAGAILDQVRGDINRSDSTHEEKRKEFQSEQEQLTEKNQQTLGMLKGAQDEKSRFTEEKGALNQELSLIGQQIIKETFKENTGSLDRCLLKISTSTDPEMIEFAKMNAKTNLITVINTVLIARASTGTAALTGAAPLAAIRE